MNEIVLTPEIKLSQLYSKTPGLLEHSLRVFRLASLVLMDITNEINPDEKQEILVASLLHDLGKATWPDAWLTNPRCAIPNTDWSIIQTHPIQSVNLCNSIGYPISEQTKKIILNHHERPGGRGYPLGIEPDLPTLIFAACDVYSACTEVRPYRSVPLNEKQAFNEVANFAPPLVLEILNKYRFKIA